MSLIHSELYLQRDISILNCPVELQKSERKLKSRPKKSGKAGYQTLRLDLVFALINDRNTKMFQSTGFLRLF